MDKCKGIRRLLTLVLAASNLSACETFSGGASTVSVQSSPTGALVTIDGVGECETPCSIKIDTPRRAIVAKAGYLPVRITLSPNDRNVDVLLELAAASTSVDSETLGEIDD